MKVCFYTISVSPHQLPLSRELVNRLGPDQYRYVYLRCINDERAKLGWREKMEPWMAPVSECSQLLNECDVLITDQRDWNLVAQRYYDGKRTLYVSERWFKPKVGILRLFSPSYRRMAKTFVRLLDEGKVVYLPMGIQAARDMARLCGLMHGDLKRLFRAPKLDFERKPGGRIFLAANRAKAAKKYCLDKMRMWGYFVEKGDGRSLSRSLTPPLPHSTSLRVLWVGRFLDWKRIDTIIRAVGKLSTCPTCSTRLKISLDIYGTGPEEARLRKLAAKYGDAIKFYPPVPIAEVRKLMRAHDVYVLSSNGYEGWGAVVSEALEEGMKVIGTYEAGASSTILPREYLFHAGDMHALLRLLEREIEDDLPPCSIGDWTAAKAAASLLEL